MKMITKDGIGELQDRYKRNGKEYVAIEMDFEYVVEYLADEVEEWDGKTLQRANK